MRWSLSGSVLLLVACTGCTEEPRLVAALHWGGFRPGCLSLAATPKDAPEPQLTTYPLTLPEQGGEILVEVRVPKGQGPTVELDAEAMEADCEGTVVASAHGQGVVGQNAPTVRLALDAEDPDDDGYISTNARPLPGTDCRELAANIHPKSVESWCDGVDDDCSGYVDDGLGLGQACASGPCTGTYKCDGQGGVDCSARLGDWYQDQDGDNVGTQYLGNFCGPNPGQAPVSGDCNDLNPAIYPGALEVCNDRDDDCDNAVDDFGFGGACQRVSIPVGANLLAVSAGSRGRAWASGTDGGLLSLSVDGGVAIKTGVCGNFDWRTVWVDAQNRPYLGGPQGKMAYLPDPGQSVCLGYSVGGSTSQVNGSWGFPSADGGTQVYMVTSNGFVDSWAPPSAPVQQLSLGSSGNNLRAIDGVAGPASPSGASGYPRIIAGWYLVGSTSYPRVWIDQQGGGFTAQGSVEAILGAGAPLYSATMPRANLAYVCGENNAVLEYENGSWAELPPPAAEMFTLNSVTAFDDTHVYVVGIGSKASWVWFWNGSTWRPVMRVDDEDGNIRAIDGTGPDDLWVVGNGNAWHLVMP